LDKKLFLALKNGKIFLVLITGYNLCKMKPRQVFFTISALTVVMPAIMAFLAVPVYAQEVFGLTESFRQMIGLGDENPVMIAAKLIRIALGFLGIIAVVLLILGGFKWMTAGGNEDKVSEAKRTIGQAIIGLLIILASYSIAQFVINSLAEATGAI
jgi:uncharacterized membrane protein